jgi:uncharacterized protein YtpQ (UPF0354 family)
VREADREFCARAVAYLKGAVSADEPAILLSHGDSPVIANLNNGLLVAYLVDEADRFEYVQQRHLESAGLNEAELHRHAIANLSALLKQKGANVRPYGNVIAVFFEGNFEASLILIDQFWEHAFAHLAPNGFIVAIPCRDILAFCDAGNRSGIQELRQIIQRTENGDHPISPVLYQRKASIWTPYVN